MQGTRCSGSVLHAADGLDGAARALDLHEESSDPRSSGCPRWPAHMRLRSSAGELVEGRCGATNQCAYCAKLRAVENTEVLQLDAMTSAPPTVLIVLTTRSPSWDARSESRRQLWRALKRRWPAVATATLIEFTTGKGPRSGGLRRPHWNLLAKGIPVEDVDQVRDLVERVWCAREDAEPAGQYVGAIATTGGLSRYLAMHFQKQSQQPPTGWKGHRLTTNGSYYGTPIAQLRVLARESLHRKREMWKLDRMMTSTGELLGDVAPDVVLELADTAVELARAKSWQLVQVHPTVSRTRPPPRIRLRS